MFLTLSVISMSISSALISIATTSTCEFIAADINAVRPFCSMAGGKWGARHQNKWNQRLNNWTDRITTTICTRIWVTYVVLQVRGSSVHQQGLHGGEVSVPCCQHQRRVAGLGRNQKERGGQQILGQTQFYRHSQNKEEGREEQMKTRNANLPCSPH